MKLREIQSHFTENLLQESGEHDNSLDRIFETGTITTHDRLGVYRNNLFKSLTNALAATYPATEKLVGQDFMKGMARAFIRDNLPRSACLSDYGADFPAFIAAWPPAAKLHYLPDIARLEWALHCAACALDDYPLNAGSLQELSPAELANVRFSLRASCRLVSAPWPVDEIHAFALADGNLPPPDINSGPVRLLVMRPELEAGFFRLEPEEYAFLQAVSEGQTLQTASEKHLAPDIENRLAAVFERHFRQQTFSAFF